MDDLSKKLSSLCEGYTMNKAALKTFVTKADSISLRRKSSAEDFYLSACLKKIANLEPIDTRDEFGHERYHHFQVRRYYYYYYVYVYSL